MQFYILDGTYIIVSDDFGCSLYWQDGKTLEEVFWTDNICVSDYGLMLYNERLLFVTEDIHDMEALGLLLDEHGENMAFANTLYELEKFYPELSFIRQGAHSMHNESRGGLLAMYGRAGNPITRLHNSIFDMIVSMSLSGN